MSGGEPAGPEPAAGAQRPRPDPAALYRRRHTAFAERAEALAGRSRALSWARLATLSAGLAGLFILLVQAAAPPGWAAAGAALAFVCFAVLMRWHARVIRDEAGHRALADLQQEALARLERRWQELPPGPEPPPGAAPPPFARDLDLYGPASLARLLGAAGTPVGRRTVARWLLEAAPPAAVRRRQEAVRELAGHLDFRQRLTLAGRGTRKPVSRTAGPADPDPAGFIAWAEGEPWLLVRPGLVWSTRLLALVAVTALSAAVFGALPWSLAALAAIVNLVLTKVFDERFDRELARVAAGGDELRAYAAALEVAASRRFAAPRLAELAADLDAGPHPVESSPGGANPAGGSGPAAAIARLRRRIEISDARHGSFHFIAQALVLWDFHALWLLERWQAAHGRRVRRWLEALAEVDALAALGGLAHDQPDWAFPELVETAPARLVATGLGHPLLADPDRVANDVELGPPGSFLLVTGSNMSGKSTLLRSLGVNAVLAQTGGPVCAAALSMPPVELATSVLVEDSLASGVSFFLAEVLRLRDMVERAPRARAGGRTLLYLIDEPLRGTNSEERRQAARRVLGHLLAAGALGAVATHDLELAADGGALAAAARPVHFRETLEPRDGRPLMSFDYRLRPGPSTTRNALRLLDLVGLGEEDRPWTT